MKTFTVLASLLLAGAAHAQSAPEAPASTAATGAVALCESAVTTGKIRPDLKVDLYTDKGIAGTTKTYASLPDLVKRFVATSGGGATPDYVFHLLSDQGGIWALARSEQASCDILVTGLDDPSLETKLLASFSAPTGWQALAQRPATAAAPLGQYIFLKRLPDAQSQDFGIRARVRSLGIKAATMNGVQIDINMVAGDIRLPAGAATAKPTP